MVGEMAAMMEFQVYLRVGYLAGTKVDSMAAKMVYLKVHTRAVKLVYRRVGWRGE